MRFTLLLCGLLAPCAPFAPAIAAQGAVPDIPVVHGDFAIRVQYPRAGSVLNVTDSTFLFGTVGDGRARLTINGAAVPVAANGAWLAWVPVPGDSAPIFRMEARLGNRRLRSDLRMVRGGWVDRRRPWALPGTMHPIGELWRPEQEDVMFSVRAQRGAALALTFADGHVLPLQAPLPHGNDAEDSASQLYRAVLRGPTGMADSNWLATAPRPIVVPRLRIATRSDTTFLPWPIQLHAQPVQPMVVLLTDDAARSGTTDRMVNGRNRPGGNYHWFFPNGTSATADAREDQAVRLRLGDGAVAWVLRTDVVALGAAPTPVVVMGSPRLRETEFGMELRVPMTAIVPHQIRSTATGVTITLFGATGDANWIQYPVGSTWLSAVDWKQHAHDRLDLFLTFSTPLFGWRVRAESGTLVFDFRRPPQGDPSAPLRGRVIVLDPGHPPLGACGPTGLCEPVATLAVARIALGLLRAEGARVVLTRRSGAPLDLGPRVRMADSVDAEALVSIHLNAHPDGVDPFTNSGTTTFFQHQHALELARALQDAMVERWQLTDLGVARGDLALVRPTWYPAVLTEALHLMIPAHEVAMGSVAGQTLYAEAIVAGLRRFFSELAVSTAAPLTRLPIDSPSPSREP